MASKDAKPVVPAGWVAVWDEEYSQWFYVNEATKKSQWEAPPGTTFPRQEQQPPPNYYQRPQQGVPPQQQQSYYQPQQQQAQMYPPQQQMYQPMYMPQQQQPMYMPQQPMYMQQQQPQQQSSRFGGMGGHDGWCCDGYDGRNADWKHDAARCDCGEQRLWRRRLRRRRLWGRRLWWRRLLGIERDTGEFTFCISHRASADTQSGIYC